MSSYLFIDDSGSKQWDTPYQYSLVNSPPARVPQNRKFWELNYFVLAGIYIEHDLLAELNPIINAKKIEVFGTKNVEIRSVNLRNPQKQEKYYIQPFGVTRCQLKDFIESFWYEIFNQNREAIQIQAVLLDKRYYKHLRTAKSPLDITAQVMFDRVEMHPNRECTIIFDQMDHQVKTEKRDQGSILQIADKTIDLGSFHKKYSHVSVGFEESKNSNFLQLADTVAYNVLRQFIDYGDKWDQPGQETLPMYSFFEKISDNMYCNKLTRQVRGYGLIKLPEIEKINWCKSE